MGVTKQHLGQWRSIEFECWFINSTAKKEFQGFVKKNNYDKRISIGDDGSIEPNEDDIEECGKCSFCMNGYDYFDCVKYQKPISAEIRVSYVSGNDKIVRDVCAFLKGRAKVNYSCGTHVHFDMRNFDAAAVRVIGAKLACAVPALRKLLPKDRRNSEYCHEDICDMDSWHDKESFVNLVSYNKYKTIEVRAHSGTLDADKILNWIAICDKIMFGNVIKGIKKPNELQKYYKFDKDLASYIKKRAKEVNKEKFVET